MSEPSDAPSPADPATAKRDLRRSVRAALAGLDPATRAEASASMSAHLRGSAIWEASRTVLGFLSLDPEPDLDGVLAGALESGRRVALPAIDWAERAMEPRQIGSLGQVVAHRHGVREPPAGATGLGLEELDLVLVPGLAFDGAGRRLGRGGGFYDRFLAGLPQSVPTVGVCFEIQRVEAVPAEAHDAPVRMLLTEMGLRATDADPAPGV